MSSKKQEDKIIKHIGYQVVCHSLISLAFSDQSPISEEMKSFYKKNKPLVHILSGTMIAISFYFWMNS